MPVQWRQNDKNSIRKEKIPQRKSTVSSPSQKQRLKHKKHKELVEQMVRAEHLMEHRIESEDIKAQGKIEVMHQVIKHGG